MIIDFVYICVCEDREGSNTTHANIAFLSVSSQFHFFFIFFSFFLLTCVSSYIILQYFNIL